MHIHKVLLLLSLLLPACSPQYLVATNFNDMLYTGMSRLEFDQQWHIPTKQALRGNLQVETHKFLIDGESWEVLTYDTFRKGSIANNNPEVDHKEFAAFRNGHLEEWGKGTLPAHLLNKQEDHSAGAR